VTRLLGIGIALLPMPVHSAALIGCSGTQPVYLAGADGKIGNIHRQLAVAKLVLHQLEVAQDRRPLEAHQESLRQFVKLKTLGLASHQWNLARQESRILWLQEGDATTKFFHAHANIQRQKKFMHGLMVNDVNMRSEEGMQKIAFNHFNNILGSPSIRSTTLNMDFLQLPQLDSAGLGS
jgi:hypothetical protein